MKKCDSCEYCKLVFSENGECCHARCSLITPPKKGKIITWAMTTYSMQDGLMSFSQSCDSSVRETLKKKKKAPIWCPMQHGSEEDVGLLKIAYSWGDEEPDLRFGSKEEAWEEAKQLALKEAEIASKEHDCEIGLSFDKDSLTINLHYTYDDSYCRYSVVEW